MSDDADARERALLLLRNHHEFPGPFEFRAVVRPESRSAVVGAVVAAVSTPQALRGLSERQSRQGTYVSIRVSVQVTSAEEVLEVYAILQALDGVVTAL